MNTIEHYLTVLSEECAETVQRASKAIRFGLQEIQPGQNETNKRRLEREFSEIIAVGDLIGLGISKDGKRATFVEQCMAASQLDKTEYLLICLIQACAIVSWSAAHAVCFGFSSTDQDNLVRLQFDLSKTVAVAELLDLEIREEDKAVKIEKLKKFMDYSRGLGLIKD